MRKQTRPGFRGNAWAGEAGEAGEAEEAGGLLVSAEEAEGAADVFEVGLGPQCGE